MSAVGETHDVAVIGAGAAGLAAAIYLRELSPAARVTLFDGARSPGAKILVSGGTRCNVTNTVVTERDFNGGSPAIVRRVLQAWPVSKTRDFFARIGVPLHEEPGGKLFPDTNRSRDVLGALLGALTASGAALRAGQRVRDLRREVGGFRLDTTAGPERARYVVLATGGLSLPKTGSDGAGYAFARNLGHTIVATTPALVPLVLGDDGDEAFHRGLTGVAQPARLTLSADDGNTVQIEGPLLWTHFGISGPAALDLSRHWLRACMAERSAAVTASLLPGETFASVDAEWTSLARARPRAHVRTVLAERVPASVAAALVGRARIGTDATLAALTRDERRTLVRLSIELPLPVRDSRGYQYAEVTAGGIALQEVNWRTMESRVCPGLYVIGEILDVDGRIGGFNFQWAWSSARVAAAGLAGRLGDGDGMAPRER